MEVVGPLSSRCGRQCEFMDDGVVEFERHMSKELVAGGVELVHDRMRRS